jgi:hypothetical protein
LTTGSYIARAAIAVTLLTPITLIMGGTLTLLIRFLVRADLAASGWVIALLYAANTTGAAAGALLTDVALVPLVGLRSSQFVAVAFNLVAAGVRGSWPNVPRWRRTHRTAPAAPFPASLRRGGPELHWPSRDAPQWAWRCCGCVTPRCCWEAFAPCSR